MQAKNGVDWNKWGFEVLGKCPDYQGIRVRSVRKSNDNISNRDSYKKWYRLLKIDRGQESDKEAVLCEEWKDYESFLKWYNENIYEVEGEEIGLSYRVLDMNNHYISPDTYIFIPKTIADLCCGKGHDARRSENHRQAIEKIQTEYKDIIPKAVYDRIMQSAEKEGAE